MPCTQHCACLQGPLARRACQFCKSHFTHDHFPYRWNPVFLCVLPPLLTSVFSQRFTQELQVVEICHSSTGKRNMSEGSGGRQGCGLRYMVVVRIRSAWRISELKAMPTSFSFPVAGMKQRSSSSVPCSSAQLCSLDMCVQQVQGLIEGK